MIDMKRIVMLSLLCGVCFCSQAQYYLNVYRNNGTKVEYLVSDLDSVTFTASVTPVIKKDVSKLSVRYIEFYSSDRKISPFGKIIAAC